MLPKVILGQTRKRDVHQQSYVKRSGSYTHRTAGTVFLQPGDKVLFEVIDGKLVIKPLKTSLESQAGCFANDIAGRIATLEDMERAIEKGLAESGKGNQ